MKAAFYCGNKTIQIGACVPVHPARQTVQIKVSHCGICGTDLHIFHGMMDRRVHMPQVMGHEMSGLVSEVGPGVEGFNAGDKVTVMPLDHCNQCPACLAGHTHICQNLKFLGIDTPGALQGYWTVPVHTLRHLPSNLSLEQGALIEPLAVACHDVRRGGVKEGDYVVVLGGGPIGTLISLVARNGHARVLVSEINPFRIGLLRELGIEAVDPRKIDLPEYIADQTGGAGADVVFEVTGTARGAETMTQLLRTRGRAVIVGISSEPPKVDLFRFFWRELQMVGARVYEDEDFDQAIQVAASGALPLDHLITKTYPLEQLESAFQQLEGSGEVMKILIRCGDQDE